MRNHVEPLLLGLPAPAMVWAFPVPPKEVSPNSRAHYMKKARAAKDYRTVCAAEWHKASRATGVAGLDAAVTMAAFFRPKGRPLAVDADNASAMLKQLWDAMQDAGVIVNDAGLSHLPVILDTDKGDPRVVVAVYAARLEIDGPGSPGNWTGFSRKGKR